MDDEAIRTLITRLSRPHPSGGRVIERAAILAAGQDSRAVLAWITAHDGEPEAVAPVAARGGLHRVQVADTAPAPRRYILPAAALSAV